MAKTLKTTKTPFSNHFYKNWNKHLKKQDVLGYKIAYQDTGKGDMLLFLHGNPTSSFLWRHIIARTKSSYRCIAPDLIGMGASDKLKNSTASSYRFNEHRQFLDTFLETILPKEGKIILVVHDWGSALGFDWAYRNPSRIKGIVYMEAIVKPLSWSDWPEQARNIFQLFKSDAGEALILEKNIFIERILLTDSIKGLNETEKKIFRAPYLKEGEDRRPTLSWPREIPVDGSPKHIVSMVKRYGDWLKTSTVPKLFINANPGSILIGAQRDFCRSWANQSEVTVKGNHFIQNDAYQEISNAILAWAKTLPS